MTDSFNVKNATITMAGCSYFVAMALLTQTEIMPVRLFWYAALLFGSVVSLIVNIHLFRKLSFAFLSVFVLTGIANYFLVGSIELKPLALMVMQFLICFLFINERFQHEALIPVILLNAALVVFKFLTVGFYGQIYVAASENYVSIYMLFPTIMYYALAEIKGKKTVLWPALIVWILSLLARGRGGIITSTLFAVGITLCIYQKKKRDFRAVVIPIVIVGISVMVINLDAILEAFGGSMVSEIFRDRGLKSSRTELWEDYIQHATSDVTSIVLGPDIHKTLSWRRYQGNAHNSYINIHANNGLISLAFVLGLVLRNIHVAIKGKKPVYLVCLIALLVRAFTDSVFWLTYGTVSLFFMLFLLLTPVDQKVKCDKEDTK
ncbi:MAG: hypothetical protein J5379_01480 [Clostridiales bacterium]|nr:hypothetical protein [Clostridiales bacterium]